MSRRFTILARKFDPFEKAVRTFWDQLAAARGLDLELDLVPLDLPELHAAILTKRFDVAHVNTDWLAECWASGCLEDLSGRTLVDPPEDYPDGWPRSLLGLQTFPDGLAGIPFHDGPECLIYRKDLFGSERERATFRARYGTELTPPRTWAEFACIADFFDRPDEGLHGTLFALYPDGHNNVFDFALQVMSRGGSLEQEGRVVLDSPEALVALQEYRSLINSPFIHPQSRELEIDRRLLDLRPWRGRHDGQLVRLRHDVRDGRGLQGTGSRRRQRHPPRRLAPGPGVAERLLRLVHQS